MTPRSVLVGGDESHYEDDVRARCVRCGVTIFLRPHTAILFPPRLRFCLPCAKRESITGVGITPEVLADLREAVATGGAGHDCQEWIHDGQCRLCDRGAYRCPDCGAISFNPSDIANRYCGACHRFETL